MPRPSEYKETYPDELFSLMKEGKKGAWLFSHFGVSRRSFYNWINKFPEFKDAYERGWEECEKFWENEGMRMIAEKDERGFKPWIAFMNRNFGWAKGTPEQAGGAQITIGTLNVFQGQTKDELIEYINKELKELQVIEGDFKILPKPEDDPLNISYIPDIDMDDDKDD